MRAAAWGSLGTGEVVMTDRRRIRALSRSTRQLLGLRTALGRHPLRLIVLDEPWEGLDPDATRWLSATLEAKRDRGAAIVLSSHRLHDLAGVCDKYLFLTGAVPALVRAHEIARSGLVSAEQLIDAGSVAQAILQQNGAMFGGNHLPNDCKYVFLQGLT